MSRLGLVNPLFHLTKTMIKTHTMLLNWWTSNKKAYEIRDLLGEMYSVSWGNFVKEPINSEDEPCL